MSQELGPSQTSRFTATGVMRGRLRRRVNKSAALWQAEPSTDALTSSSGGECGNGKTYTADPRGEHPGEREGWREGGDGAIARGDDGSLREELCKNYRRGFICDLLRFRLVCKQAKW